jgi:hypothetical protein
MGDLSRYMWAAIKDIQARVEGKSSVKLKALHTNHGGEFTVMEFTYYHAVEGVHRQHIAPYNPQ